MMVMMMMKYDLIYTEKFNRAICAKDPRKLTLQVGVTFSIVAMKLDEATKQLTVNVRTPTKESSEI